MEITYLEKSDIASYKALIDKVFGSSNDISEYDNYERGNYEILVAKDGEKIAGTLGFYKMELFSYDHQPSLELFNLAVDPDYRGRGIADALFEHMLNYAKENSYKSISVNCGKTAYAAHKLYEKMGFSENTSVRFSRRLD